MPTPAISTKRALGWFKTLIFALIGFNALIFSVHGTLPEIIDTLAWLTLLALFELETAHPHLLQHSNALRATHWTRIAAGAAICVAAVGYLHERAWFDAVNIALWIGVVMLLEFEVRFPALVSKNRKIFGGTAALLYLALAVMVAAWAWHREWFDAYDALLWLTAFLFIEMNVLRQPESAPQDGAPHCKR